MGGTGTDRLTLEDNLLTGSLGFLAGSVVFLDTAQEIDVALGGLDVLNADIDAFLHEATTDTLVDDQAEGAGSDVVDDGSAAVVELVGHTLVDGTVSLDVDQVSDLVGDHVGGQLGETVFAESTGEHVTGASAITKGVRHFYK